MKPKQPLIVSERVIMPEQATIALAWKGDRATYRMTEKWDTSNPRIKKIFDDSVIALQQMKDAAKATGDKDLIDFSTGTDTIIIRIEASKDVVLNAVIGELIANTSFADLRIKDLILVYSQFKSFMASRVIT